MHVPGARSLKEKRAVVRSAKDRLRRLNVSVAEVDHQALWQRCRLEIAAVGESQATVAKSLDSVIEDIDRHDPGLIIASDIEWLT
jgi:uncharacterized protein YlxP (DUF503 family)